MGDGFLIIRSRSELDVVIVFTALPMDTTKGISMDVEYIEPHIVSDF